MTGKTGSTPMAIGVRLSRQRFLGL